MSIALLVIQDCRRDYLVRCLASAAEMLAGPIVERWVFDDSGDPAYRAWLAERWPEFEQIVAPARVGFGGAIRASWTHLLTHSRADWIAHLEQDFVFNRDIDLAEMADVLADRPHLTQMALRRQAWNAAEKAAGGIVEQHPCDYADMRDERGREWLEHRRFFTTNPGLYRRSLMTVGWPDGPESEGHFGLKLWREGTPEAGPDEVRSGYWGRRTDPPWVEHIGHVRNGSGY